MLRGVAQKLIIAAVAPYIRAELPKWGRVYRTMVGSFEREPFWSGAPVRAVKNKLYGFSTLCDLSRWPERQTFFLRRWFDLPAQLLILGAAGRGGTVVDIGANRGQFTLAAASIVGPCGQIISFEPNPSQAEILRRDLERNGIRNVALHEIGLGDEDAILPLCVPHVNSGNASFGGFASEGDIVEGLRVRVGDDVLEGTKPDLIKIDVEGFELRVLRGLRRLITSARPIILTEVVPEHLARCGTSAGELFEFMEGFGYRGAGVSTRRRGRHQALSFCAPQLSSDVVWVPKGYDLGQLVRTTAALRSCG